MLTLTNSSPMSKEKLAQPAKRREYEGKQRTLPGLIVIYQKGVGDVVEIVWGCESIRCDVVMCFCMSDSSYVLCCMSMLE
jgi:hypothetical protein